MSYELLSGRYAFPDARLAGMRPLIQAHLNDKPRPLLDVAPEVPAAIADVVMKYLRKQPQRRPSSAGVLRAAIAGYLGIDERSLVSGASLVEMRTGLSVTGFVCRTTEQVLNQRRAPSLPSSAAVGLNPFEEEMPPHSPVVAVASQGIGKSSVVQEAERVARGHGCQVYEGRCFGAAIFPPFQPFVEIRPPAHRRNARLQDGRQADGPTDEDLTATHVAGLPAHSLVRLQAVVNGYRGELLRMRPSFVSIFQESSYQPGGDRPRSGLHPSVHSSAFFLEIATAPELDPARAWKTCNGLDRWLARPLAAPGGALVAAFPALRLGRFDARLAPG